MSATEALRERLRVFLNDAAQTKGERQCPMCHGTGTVIRPVRSVTQSDIAKLIGVSRTTVTGFLGGKQGLTFDAAMTLIAYLDAPETKAGAALSREPSL